MAYALAFGALLLLGGRIAGYWGRKRTFLVGMLGFGAPSVLGGVAGAGAAVGLLLGGVLTEFADWRWRLLVNVFFVIVSFIGALLFVAESKTEGDNRYDVLGALTVSLGLGALAFLASALPKAAGANLRPSDF